jgi:DNA-binding NtrC family response regulator
VRELENCVERMVLLARAPRLTPADLPPNVRRGSEPKEPDDSFHLPADGVRLPELERHLIVEALQRTRGALGPAARLLGISYKTLQYRIQKHDIRRPGDPDAVPGASADS